MGRGSPITYSTSGRPTAVRRRRTGKGHDYLSGNEAKDEESLAKSQLAGLKLFVLAALCSVGRGLLRAVAYGDNNATVGHWEGSH